MVALLDRQPSVEERLASRPSRIDRISIHQIGVDLRFQRALNPATVRKIKQQFHRSGLGIILVIDLGVTFAGPKRYLVIDGQTRIVTLLDMLKESPDRTDIPDMIPAEIFEGLDEDECALLFRLRNTQKLVPVGDHLRLLETEREPLALKVRDDAASVGYVVFSLDARRPATLTTNDVKAARQIAEWGLKKKRPDLLVQALSVHAQAFTAEGIDGTLAGTVRAKILQAVARVLLKNPSITPEMLAARLDSQAGIVFDAEKDIETGTTSAQAYQRALAARYNRGRRKSDGKGDLLKV